jgi:hypothetical protein
MKQTVVGVLAIAAIVFCLMFYQEIAAALIVIGYVVSGVLVIVSLLGLVFGGWYLIERIRMVRAVRIESEKQAHVMTVVSGNQVFIRDTSHRASWRAAHLDSRVYTNGQYSEPSPVETWAWEVFNAPKRVYSSPTALLRESVESEPLDLLTIFTQPTQSYAVIGGQQTGKTFQMQHIAHYWLRVGLKPIVIGPKWDKGEWAGCILFGGNGDVHEVAKGIAIIRKIVEQRHANTTKSHKEHKLLPVFFDDWTPIVDSVEHARQLILEATTLYASVNILLYFMLHSDTANAWGVDRKGAALKDNFIKLFIIPHYDANGLIVRERTRGYIRFAGETVDRPVKLFHTPLPSLPVFESMQAERSDIEIAAIAEPVRSDRVKPTEKQQAVLGLWDAGERSESAIALRVYRTAGGRQIELVKRTLQKFGRI